MYVCTTVDKWKSEDNLQYLSSPSLLFDVSMHYFIWLMWVLGIETQILCAASILFTEYFLQSPILFSFWSFM